MSYKVFESKIILAWVVFIFPLSASLPVYQGVIQSQEEVISPLDHFFDNIPSLPRYAEAGYSPLGRSPVVDVLLADPLYMPAYAEAVANLIKKETRAFPLQTALWTASGIPLRKFFKKEGLIFDHKAPESLTSVFPEHLAQRIYSYWLAFLDVRLEVERILSPLSEQNKDWLRKNYDRFFFGRDEKRENYDFFTTDSPYPLIFFNLASKIDLAALADCSRKLSVIFDDFYDFREAFAQVTLENDVMLEENDVKFFISQKKGTIHEENADFFIDLGGYNTIRTNAGGTEGVRPIALHIDLKGHNTYEGESFVQGAGFLGIGMLASCSGNNSYTAKSYSQGCGFLGSGSLINLSGDNRFNLNFGGQSFGLFGSSLLWNFKGGNRYLAKEGMAQAATSTLGVAFLIDNEGGNSYEAGIPGKTGTTREGGIGQGGSAGVRGSPWLNNPSFYGGLSFLYAGSGLNKFKTVWIGQGSAYFLGAGIVVAEGSQDLFEADYDAQGQGLHLAAGLLLTKGGLGQFKGGWGSIGVSGDRSVGMFLSKAGGNRYEGTDQSIGSSRKPKSVGVFIGLGDDNIYNFRKLSNARLQFPETPREWSSALFLDLGSGSQFPSHVDEFTRGAERFWGIKDHSLGASMNIGKEDAERLFLSKFHARPDVSFTFDPINGWEGNCSYKPLVYNSNSAPQTLAEEIPSADYERRRQIYETLDLIRFNDRKIDADLSFLLRKPAEIPEDAFNYAVLWGLRNKDKIDLSPIKAALKEKKFSSGYARKMAAALAGTFWMPDTALLLFQLMMEDPIEEIRYSAAYSLAFHLPEGTEKFVEAGVKSPSASVRYAIMLALQESQSPLADHFAEQLFNDPSFYVRRAAGLTAISLRDKKGIPVVLETLRYETLDTEENYGDNIYRKLSIYLGVDFGLDREAWIRWWEEVKDHFDFPKKSSLQLLEINK